MSDQRMNRGETHSDAARQLLAAARERFSVAAIDVLLPEHVRLTEWHRITAAGLLAQLIRTIEDALRASLAGHFADHEALRAAFSSAHVPIALPILERSTVLRDAELGMVLVRRVEEHRFYKDREGGDQSELLFELVRDGD